MIPKISAVLSQILSPLATAQTAPVSGTSKDPLPKKHSEQQQQRPQAKVVPISRASEEGESSEPEESRAVTAPSTPTGALSTAHSLIQLLSLFKQQRKGLGQWLGIKSYYSALRGQKRGSRFRKGAMLDQRVG